jgi:Flp pilus assembly protein TadG
MAGTDNIRKPAADGACDGNGPPAARGAFAAIRRFLGEEEGGRGQALVEFSLAFPLQLLLTFGILQLLLLYISALVTDYAAFRAARAAVVQPRMEWAEASAHQAARIVLSPLAHTGPSASETLRIPGWGALEGSDRADERVRVRLAFDPDDVDLTATVEWNQELVFPVVDRLLAFLYSLRGEAPGAAFGESYAVYADFDDAPSPVDSPDAPRLRRIGDRYFYVVVQDCTLYARQGTSPARHIHGL